MKNYIALLGLILVLFSCTDAETEIKGTSNSKFEISNPEYGEWQTREPSPIKFEVEESYGVGTTDENAILTVVSSMFVDNNDNVYVLDARAEKIISYNKSGEVRWTVNSPGRGPGDISQPKTIVWNNNNAFYLSNLNGKRLDKFSLEGEFLETITIPAIEESIELVGYSDNKLIVSSPIRGSFGNKFTVLNADSNYAIQNSFTIDLTGELEVPKISHWFPKTTLLDGELVHGGVSEYEYHFWKLDSTKTKVVKRDFGKLVRPGLMEDEEGSIVAALGGMNTPLKLDTNYYVASSNWPVDVDDPDVFLEGLYNGTITEFKLKNTIDFYDKKWNLLYSAEGDDAEHSDFGNPRFVDSKGFVYSSFTAPYPHIKKFKVTIDR